MTAEPGRILALDLGEARIGVALSDPLGITAQPLPTLRRVGPKKDVEALVRLAREREVATIVVGLPLLLSGETGTQAEQAQRFAADLRCRLDGVEVVCWDERMTSVQAERTLIAGNVRRERRRRHVDALAAVLILQSYLDARGAGRGDAEA